MRYNNGFTLVEMAVVLTLLALVLGAIIVGDSMIRGSQLRSISNEFSQYTKSIAEFRDKYMSLPGDFADAQSFFGVSPICPSASSAGTCNGNGNGKINDQAYTTALNGSEQFLAWHHLYMAKMIDQRVNGTTGPLGHADRFPGVNIPSSKLSGAGWGLTNNTGEIPAFASDVPINTALWLGGRSETATNNRQRPLLTTREAYNIDLKFDDGYPNMGKIIAQTASGSCSVGVNAEHNYFNLLQTAFACTLVFKTGL